MTIARIYVTLMSAIFAGIVNSIFCKSKSFKLLKVPMDFNKNFIDGKRVFGDNKTWKGFIGYIIFNIIFAIIFGFIWKVFKLENYNYFYLNNSNTIMFNLLIGFLLGLFYALFELPNSFIKRRLDISPGKTKNGFFKYLFVFIDQADSIFGLSLVVWMFYPIGIGIYILSIILGAVTHILINMFLYLLHLRKNMF